MELTKKAIFDYKKKIPGIEGYLVLVKKIDKNININPDIAIEACKALIEGLSKKALELLSDKYNSNKGLKKDCDNSLPKLIRSAFSEVYKNSFELDIHSYLYDLIEKESKTDNRKSIKRIESIITKNSQETLEKIEKAIVKISVIRDNRGDISHGRIYPKKQESSIHLSKSISSITDGICSFMINEIGFQYLEKKLDYEKLDYEVLDDFNNWLNDKLNVLSVKVDYSKLLFKNAYDKYEEFYFLEYIDSLDDEIEDEEIVVETKPEATVEPQKEELVTTFDEVAFWVDAMDEKVEKFAETEKLKIDELKNLINNYLFSSKEPLRDDVVKAMNAKPSLKDRAKIADKLTGKIIDLANDLKIQEEEL